MPIVRDELWENVNVVLNMMTGKIYSLLSFYLLSFHGEYPTSNELSVRGVLFLISWSNEQ